MRSSNSRFPLPSPFKRTNLVLISGFDAALAEKPVATTGYFLLGNQRRLTHRHHIIQHLIHRQLAQHDDLGDAEQGLRWLPSSKAAKSPSMTLAEPRDSLALTNSDSVSVPGLTMNMLLAWYGGELVCGGVR